MEASTSSAVPSTSKQLDPEIQSNVEEDHPVEASTSAETSSTTEPEEQSIVKKEYHEIQYFECALCKLKERYEYFGKDPPFYRFFLLKEDAYVIEDPFVPPRQGEILILGAHCVACNIMVCKDTNCSIFWNGTYCVKCAKKNIQQFPKVVQEKLNKIIVK